MHPAPPHRILLAAALGAALALAGCAGRLAPAPLPDLRALESPFRHDTPDHPDLRDATTWRGFGDPVLDRLLARGQVANLDVRLAVERVRQARAGSSAAASRLQPTVAITGSVSDQRSGLPEAVRRSAPDTRALRGAIDLGWELDVFGAARAAADGAELDSLAADAAADTARWLTTTELARQYLLWQGARLRLQYLQALLTTQQDTERLVRSRQAQGMDSALAASLAAGEVQALAAQLPPLRTLVAVTGHQIDLLLGAAPGAVEPDWRDAQAPRLPLVPVLSPGQPIDLLLRRPDLRAARQQWLAEAARLRESDADQWPRFFLSAVLGGQDLRLNALDLAPVRFSNVAWAFTAPLFNAGRLQAAVQRQSARERAASLQYERAMLAALQDVENSLVLLAQERERHAALTVQVHNRARGLRHVASLHREGQSNLLQLQDAQRGLIAAELALLDSHTQLALGTVQLVKALGGGWHGSDPATTRIPPTSAASAPAP